MDPSNISLTGQKAVKVHVFRPSGRRICTVVGKDEEYWTAPELDFCSCKSYYFGSLSSGRLCYHLTGAHKVIREGSFALFEFADYEYDCFIEAIINDTSKNVLTP